MDHQRNHYLPNTDYSLPGLQTLMFQNSDDPADPYRTFKNQNHFYDDTIPYDDDFGRYSAGINRPYPQGLPPQRISNHPIHPHEPPFPHHYFNVFSGRSSPHSIPEASKPTLELIGTHGADSSIFSVHDSNCLGCEACEMKSSYSNSYGLLMGFDHPHLSSMNGEENSELPLRPGEPECSYYMRTGLCKYGVKCKFHHPRESIIPNSNFPNIENQSHNAEDSLAVPHQTSMSGSDQYQTNWLQNGSEKVSDIAVSEISRKAAANGLAAAAAAAVSAAKIALDMDEEEGYVRREEGYGRKEEGYGRREEGYGRREEGYGRREEGYGRRGEGFGRREEGYGRREEGYGRREEGYGREGEKDRNETSAFGTPAPLNSFGFPIRPDEPECAFYMKSRNCKYGPSCKFDHPDIMPNFVDPPMPMNFPCEDAWQPVCSFRLLPERPGQPECSFYMKTGGCKFGSGCKFHHPRIRPCLPASVSPKPPSSPVKLTLAGLPRREGEQACTYYMKTGTCKYGPTCKFDHPPPGEAVAKAASLVGKKEERNGVAQPSSPPSENNHNDEDEDKDEDDNDDEDDARHSHEDNSFASSANHIDDAFSNMNIKDQDQDHV